MKHFEIRDLWCQREVGEGKLRVAKVLGTENPADLMTKTLNTKQTEERLITMNLMIRMILVIMMITSCS